MLSRLHRRAEALDEACLRALGHPNDHSIRRELLVALEWDASFHPEHAHSAIRDLFRQVHDRSTELSERIRAYAGGPGDPSHPVEDIHGLRRSVVMLVQILAARRAEPPKG